MKTHGDQKILLKNRSMLGIRIIFHRNSEITFSSQSRGQVILVSDDVVTPTRRKRKVCKIVKALGHLPTPSVSFCNIFLLLTKWDTEMVKFMLEKPTYECENRCRGHR